MYVHTYLHPINLFFLVTWKIDVNNRICSGFVDLEGSKSSLIHHKSNTLLDRNELFSLVISSMLILLWVTQCLKNILKYVDNLRYLKMERSPKRQQQTRAEEFENLRPWQSKIVENVEIRLHLSWNSKWNNCWWFSNSVSDADALPLHTEW